LGLTIAADAGGKQGLHAECEGSRAAILHAWHVGFGNKAEQAQAVPLASFMAVKSQPVPQYGPSGCSDLLLCFQIIFSLPSVL